MPVLQPSSGCMNPSWGEICLSRKRDDGGLLACHILNSGAAHLPRVEVQRHYQVHGVPSSHVFTDFWGLATK